MNAMIPRNRRMIDTGAICHNMREIRSLVPAGVMIMAVVKADGYGHGAVESARAALKGGADMLAVASVAEGSKLRDSGIQAPVLVLGAAMQADAAEGVRNRLIQTVCSARMVYMLEKAASDSQQDADIHLKIDTGMGRIGVRSTEEIQLVLDALHECSHVHLTGAFTHFSDADDTDGDGLLYTRMQFERFTALTKMLPKGIIRHCSNSAAIHRMPEMCLDMVRAGISLYGYPPVLTPGTLEPCMRWTAKVSYIKTLPAGEFVSYGRTYRTTAETRIATITCGYADGYHRIAAEKAQVLIRGQRAPVIGRICMDQMMADITGLEGIEEGDEVVLMGTSGNETITAEDLAQWSHTISYEILLSVGSRVEREFCDHL